MEIKKYLNEDRGIYYININGKECAESVHGRGIKRFEKAQEQAKLPPAAVGTIVDYIKEYLGFVGIETTEQPIINPQSIDYDEIKEQFGLQDKKDIIWLKFTKDGYLCVVAMGDDINFDIPKNSDDYDKKRQVYNPEKKTYEEKWVHNSSGILLHKLGKEWDKSFVLLFPLKNIPQGYNRGDVEKAIGNWLIYKEVPVLDYYSHNY